MNLLTVNLRLFSVEILPPCYTVKYICNTNKQHNTLCLDRTVLQLTTIRSAQLQEAINSVMTDRDNTVRQFSALKEQHAQLEKNLLSKSDGTLTVTV